MYDKAICASKTDENANSLSALKIATFRNSLADRSQIFKKINENLKVAIEDPSSFGILFEILRPLVYRIDSSIQFDPFGENVFLVVESSLQSMLLMQ